MGSRIPGGEGEAEGAAGEAEGAATTAGTARSPESRSARCLTIVAAPTVTPPATSRVMPAATTFSVMFVAALTVAGELAVEVTISGVATWTTCVACPPTFSTTFRVPSRARSIQTSGNAAIAPSPPFSVTAISQLRRKLILARWIRALACAGVMSRATAISLWERPSSSRSTSAVRCEDGRPESTESTRSRWMRRSMTSSGPSEGSWCSWSSSIPSSSWGRRARVRIWSSDTLVAIRAIHGWRAYCPLKRCRPW